MLIVFSKKGDISLKTMTHDIIQDATPPDL